MRFLLGNDSDLDLDLDLDLDHERDLVLLVLLDRDNEDPFDEYGDKERCLRATISRFADTNAAERGDSGRKVIGFTTIGSGKFLL